MSDCAGAPNTKRLVACSLSQPKYRMAGELGGLKPTVMLLFDAVALVRSA